jgi:peptidoglycan/LPS O-acetylase OafA/YrhL
MALVLASIVPARIPPMFPDLYWWIPMMQSWVLGSGKAPVLLAVEEAALTWSLSTEVFFYAVFPFLCLLVFRRMKWRTYVRLEVPLLAVVSVVVVLLLYVLWPVVLKLQPQMSWLHVTWWWGYQSPYAQIFAFLSGVAIA